MNDNSRKSNTTWKRKLLALAVASCFAGELAHANPAGPTVTRGQATFATQGNTLTVTNTPGTIINWQSFSIPSQNITQFLQQSGASAVLNRVTGATPSTILGQLQSNGRVFLINPNGITIGRGAVVDVAGFVASSLSLSDTDFAAGRQRFTETPGAGAVVNHGEIKTSAGGMVYLVGQNIENHGVIRTPQGEIVLAAGKTIELVDAGTPEIRVQISAPDNQALNLGQLFASGGRIGMYAGIVRHGGTANANTAVVGENGKIVFKAVKDVRLEAGSVTTASGPTAGSIKVEAQTGTVVVAGTVEANAAAGRGGNIEVSGQQGVTVEPTGRVRANGVEGGTIALSSSSGPVRVSGQVSADAGAGRGGQIAIAAATQATVTAGARIGASGSQTGGAVSLQGNQGVTLEAGTTVQANGAAGGAVTLNAEQGSVEINGTIEAKGNEADGGLIRVAALSDITLGDTSVLSVSGRAGGETRIEAREGTTLASGAIDAFGRDGPGGKVLLLGPRVGLVRNASVNASGLTGGGTVLVGGDFQGGNPDIQNAKRTYIGHDALITADAIETGNGGKVIIWADGDTRFYGSITARGGQQSGNGGFVEISGKQDLAFAGLVGLSAPYGKAGSLLLDPGDLYISVAVPAGDPTAVLDATNPFEAVSGVTNNYAVKATIEAVDGAVTLLANNNVIFETSLSMTNQGAGETVTVTATSGAIQFNSNSLSTIGGNIVLSAGTNVSNIGGLNAGAGTVTITAGGTISQTGAIVGGLLTTSSVGGTILNAANTVTSFNATNITSGNIELTNTAAPLTVAGISQAGGGSVIIDNAGAIAVTGATVTGGDLTLDAGGSVTFTGVADIGGNLTVNSIANGGLGAPITDTGAGQLLVNGKTSLTAGTGSITLDNAANDFGLAVTVVSANNVTLEDTDTLTLSTMSALGDATFNAGGAVTFTGVAGIGGNLTVDSIANGGAGAAITDTGTGQLLVGGTTNLTAGTGSIALNNVANDFGAAVTVVSANNVALEDANALTLAVVNAAGNATFGAGGAMIFTGLADIGGDLTLNADGAVTQQSGGAITATNLALLGTGSYTLTNAGNNVATIAANGPTGVEYTDSNALIVGMVGSTTGMNVAGDIQLTTLNGGTLTINSPISTTSGGNVTLNNAGQVDVNAAINADGNVIQNGAGTIVLNADITTTNDLVRFERDVLLTGDHSIDTSSAPSGGTFGGRIHFAGEVNGGTNSLTLETPGITGDVLFDQSVSNLSGLTIVNANNVTAASTVGTNVGGAISITSQGTATFLGPVTSGGPVTFRVDDLVLTGTINAGANAVVIRPDTTGQLISLGSTGAAPNGNTLHISDAELDRITTSGLLTIGGANHTGKITVAGAISPSNASGGFTLLNQTGGIAVNAPITYTVGAGNLRLTANAAGATVGAITDDGGGLLTADNLFLNAARGIGTSGDPLHVTGTHVTVSNTTSGGVFIEFPTGDLNLVRLNNGGSGLVSLSTVDGSITTGAARNTASGPVELVANATGATPSTITIGTGGLRTNQGAIRIAAADDVTINGVVNTTGGAMLPTSAGAAITIAAGRDSGMLHPGSAVIPATEVPADSDGALTLNARMVAGTGAMTLYATESVTQPSGVGGNDGLQNTGTLTVRTFNNTAGAAVIDLQNDHRNPAAPAAPNPALSFGNTNGAVTVETRKSGDASAPGEPAGGYAASNIDYRSYSGVVISGIGTSADFVAIAATQDINLDALNIQARNLTLIAHAGDVNVNTQITNSQINSGNTGGSLNLLASGNVNVNHVAGTHGITIGRVKPNVDPNTDFDPSAGLPKPEDIEKFDHGLKLVAQGDIKIEGSIYLKGDLKLRADASVAESTTVGGAIGYGDGAGSVIIRVPGTATNPVVVSADDIVVGTFDSLNRPLPVQNLTVTAGNASPGDGVGQSMSASLEAAGKLEVFLTGDMTLTGGTITAGNQNLAATTVENAATATIAGNTVTIRGLKNSDNPLITATVNNSGPTVNNSNITLQGGTATATDTGTNQGIAKADASALIVAGQRATIDIGGDFRITGGVANANGAHVAALAIAGTEIGTQITGTELLTVNARNMYINSGTANSQAGGVADGFASLASSGAVRITVTGDDGLVLVGAGGSGLFDALGPSLIRVVGTGYPITVTGRIQLLVDPLADPDRQDSLVVAGAPLIDESLLAAFLRATEAAREETLVQDPNLQNRGSKGQAGVCK